MAKPYPYDLIPESGGRRADLEPGTYLAEIEAMTPGSSKKGLFQISATYRVAEPSEVAGTPLWEYYTIGTNDDADAEDPATWQASSFARQWKRVLTKARVPVVKDVDSDCAAAVGRRLLVEVFKEVEPAKDKFGHDNPYAGKIKNRVRETWAVGEKPAVGAPRPVTVQSVMADGHERALTCPLCSASFSTAEYGTHVATAH